MDVLLGALTKQGRDLVRETDTTRMAALDLDGLVDLHKRVRRARNKAVESYRQEASSKATKRDGRGIARPKNQRNAARAEVLEDALARVSAALAEAAAAAAAELRAQRLSIAGEPTPAVPSTPAVESTPAGEPAPADDSPTD